MKMLMGTCVALSAAFFLVACDNESPLGCNSNDSCPSGHVCQSNKCEQLCAVDTDCPSGTYCDGEVCISGDRNAPILDDIYGNGPDHCVAETLNTCIETGIVVTGKNLGGSEFSMESTLDGITYAMVTIPGGRIDSEIIDLAPVLPEGATDVEPGSYKLVAVNSAGSDEGEVELLRGVQGEPGPQGPLGPTGVQGPRGNPGEAGNGAITSSFFLNDEAVDETDANGGRMHITVEVERDAFNVHAVDDDLLHLYCGDHDGCTLTMAAGSWKTNSGIVIQSPLPGAPCKFFLSNVTHEWSVSEHCTENYATVSMGAVLPNQPLAIDPTYGWQPPYLSAGFGTDNSTADGLDYSHVLDYRTLCYFSEAAPKVADGSDRPMNNDIEEGFFLWGTWESWYPTNGPNGYHATDWDHAFPIQRTCELTIDD